MYSLVLLLSNIYTFFAIHSLLVTVLFKCKVFIKFIKHEINITYSWQRCMDVSTSNFFEVFSSVVFLPAKQCLKVEENVVRVCVRVLKSEKTYYWTGFMTWIVTTYFYVWTLDIAPRGIWSTGRRNEDLCEHCLAFTPKPPRLHSGLKFYLLFEYFDGVK